MLVVLCSFLHGGGVLRRWNMDQVAGRATVIITMLIDVKQGAAVRCKAKRAGGVLQIWTTNTEQRFQMRAHGDTRREIAEFDGLQLVRVPLKDESTE